MSDAVARPPGVPAALFPFESRHLDLDGLRYHYLHEGAGDPVVMLHGNPTWSFYYRNLVERLRGRHRVIVPDHIGCGLSDKPGDDRYDYHLERRVADLDALLTRLGALERVTLVLHDWGGMIGMAWAADHPGAIARLVLLNTAAFHLPRMKRLPWQLRLARTPVGALLIRGLNLFSWGATRYGCRRPLPREVLRAYRAPYDSWQNRIATLRFVEDIPLAPGDRGYDRVSAVDAALARFRDTPTLICWGLRDFVFDASFLEGWRARLPNARVHAFEDAGHLILEDEPRVIGLIEEFLGASAGTAP